MVKVSWPFLEFYTPCKISATANASDFKFCTRVGHAKSLSCDEWVFPKWAWSGSRQQFLHCGLRKFRHSKSSVDRWYTQLDRRRFVYDTYKTMKTTRTLHGWVHMFTTHRPTLTLQLHNFDLFRTCRTALLRGNWQGFNWHDASCGPSAIAELLGADGSRCVCSPCITVKCIRRVNQSHKERTIHALATTYHNHKR